MIEENQAVGKDGQGGGIYNLGATSVDEESEIEDNKASDSHDNVFGDLDLLF